MNVAPEDSIKKRYIYSLAINVLLFIPRFLNASLVPRSLGPARYGDFQFLINNFLSIKNFLDLGTSTAFFTYNAKNDEPSNLNFHYLLWWAVQLVLVVAFVAAAYLLGAHSGIWPRQDIENIALAAVCTWVFLLAQQLVQFGDSKGLTVVCQKANLAANFVAAAFLVSAYSYGILTMRTAMLLYIVGPLILIIFLTARLSGRYFAPGRPFFKDFSKNYEYFREYCAPLAAYTLAVFIFDFADRWLLQSFGGSVAQGYYTLSYNWAAIALLFFNPLLNIFWREVSVFAKDGAHEMIGTTFVKFAKFSFVIASFVVIFMALNSEKIIYHIAGLQFTGAGLSFFIMLFYPLTQIYGQLIGCVYFSMERLRTYRDVGILFMFVNLALTALILIFGNMFYENFQFRAEFYSLKFFVTGLVGSDVMVYLICSKIKVRYFELVRHRIAVIVLFALSACVNCVNRMWTDNIFLLTSADIILYTMLCAGFTLKLGLLKEFTHGEKFNFDTLMKSIKS